MIFLIVGSCTGSHRKHSLKETFEQLIKSLRDVGCMTFQQLEPIIYEGHAPERLPGCSKCARVGMFDGTLVISGGLRFDATTGQAVEFEDYERVRRSACKMKARY